jgi:hypothetical protein
MVILALSDADQPSGCPNPNTEYRNPKEGRKPKTEYGLRRFFQPASHRAYVTM